MIAALHRGGASLAGIGRALNRDHTTIRNSLMQVDIMEERNPAIRELIDEFTEIGRPLAKELSKKKKGELAATKH